MDVNLYGFLRASKAENPKNVLFPSLQQNHTIIYVKIYS